MWFPTFATDRISRTRAGWRAKSLATITTGNVQRIAAANPVAQESGIGPGMTLADARALVPSLLVEAADPAADIQALRRLADWCGRYTPWCAIDQEDQGGGAGLWLDVTGCAHLFGGEAALIADITKRLSGFGFTARAALADTPGAAWAWARHGSADSAKDAIIAPGRQREQLTDLPVAGLRLGADTLETLTSLGLRHIGDLYALPRPSLAARFGDLLLCRLDQALGTRAEPISPRQPRVAYRAVLNFIEPITEAASIAAATDRLLHDLCASLARHDLGGRQFDLVAYRADGTTDSLCVGTGKPTRDPIHLKRLFAEHLIRIAPGFGIDTMVLAARVVEPLTAQQAPLAALDGTAAPPDLTHLFDVLGTRLGHAQVMRLAARASHIPERAVARLPPSTTIPPPRNWPIPIRPLRPVRLLPRPEPIEASAMLPDDPPFQFVWRRILHRVAQAQGPERIAGEWWRDDGLTRDYYQVEDMAGRRFWVYRNNIECPQITRWFLHGLFG